MRTPQLAEESGDNDKGSWETELIQQRKRGGRCGTRGVGGDRETCKTMAYFDPDFFWTQEIF